MNHERFELAKVALEGLLRRGDLLPAHEPDVGRRAARIADATADALEESARQRQAADAEVKAAYLREHCCGSANLLNEAQLCELEPKHRGLCKNGEDEW
jgi:hypothetical protein